MDNQQWSFKEKIRLIDCYLSDTNLETISRHLTDEYGKDRAKNFFSIKSCNQELTNIIQEPFPGHLKEGLPEKYSRKQILESWLKYFQKQEDERAQFQEKMKAVKLRKIWKLIEDARDGKISHEEIDRMYQERLEKDEGKGEAYNQRVAELVKKLPPKILFKTKNIQEVIDILTGPEKSPTKTIGSDWTESLDEDDGVSETEIPDEIIGPAPPTMMPPTTVDGLHHGNGNSGVKKTPDSIKLSDVKIMEESPMVVLSPILMVPSPEKRTLRNLTAHSGSEHSIEVSPSPTKPIELQPTTTTGEVAPPVKGRRKRRVNEIQRLQITLDSAEILPPASKRRRGRPSVSSTATPEPLIPVSPSLGEKSSSVASPVRTPPPPLPIGSPAKERRTSRLSEGAPPMQKPDEPMEIDTHQPASKLELKPLEPLVIPPSTIGTSVPSLGKLKETLGVTATIGIQTNLSVRHRLPKKEHEARFSSPHRARRTSSRGKLIQHLGVQTDRVTFNQDDEIHYIEIGPTNPFISSVLVDEEEEDIKPSTCYIKDVCLFFGPTCIRKLKIDVATIAEIEAERKSSEETKNQSIAEEKRKLRSPTKEMKLLVKVGDEEMIRSVKEEHHPLSVTPVKHGKDRRSSIRQKLNAPKPNEEDPVTKNKLEILQALNGISQYKESYMFKEVPTDKLAPNYSKAIKW